MWSRNEVSGNSKPVIRINVSQLSLFEFSNRKKLVRVFHPYEKWEEFHFGMWRALGGQEAEYYLKRAIAFTGDAPLYGSYMKRVTIEWPISCEHNLTCVGLNRHAWIGHAACALAFKCPEHIVREAWHHLTEGQRNAANIEAGNAIRNWEDLYLYA